MSSSEFIEWVNYFGGTPFFTDLVDMEFASLKSTVVQLVGGGSSMRHQDFLLFNNQDTQDVDMTDEMIQSASEGIMGGVRYERADS